MEEVPLYPEKWGKGREDTFYYIIMPLYPEKWGEVKLLLTSLRKYNDHRSGNTTLNGHVKGAGGIHQDFLEIDFLVVFDREE